MLFRAGLLPVLFFSIILSWEEGRSPYTSRCKTKHLHWKAQQK